MSLRIDVELSEAQIAAMNEIPATSWFTSVTYNNAQSPTHPSRRLAVNNDMKQSLVNDWIAQAVKGKRVLDLFSANGAFAFLSAMAGAKEVVGVEFAQDRIDCARFIASTLNVDCKIEFINGDVYKLTDYFDEPFDVALCLGGLYHIADPPYVLRQIRALTKEHLILQTAQVIPIPVNWGRFVVRRQDRTKAGMTSIRGGHGVWHLSPPTLREILLDARFKILQERQPSWRKRLKRFRWYLAYCEVLP